MKYLVTILYLISFSVFSQDFSKKSNINASEMATKLNSLKKEKFIQRFVRNSELKVSGTSYSYQTLFSLTNLDTNKKYKIVSPTYIKFLSESGGASMMYLDNKQIQYFYVTSTGYQTDQIDYEFIPSQSNLDLTVYSRYNSGLGVDFNGQIVLDLYEVIEDDIIINSGDLISSEFLNNVLDNTQSKGELVDDFTMSSSAGINTTLRTYNNLEIGSLYHIFIPYTRFYNAGCGSSNTSVLTLGGKEISSMKLPDDGYTTLRTEVDFIADNETMDLYFNSTGGSCTQRGFNLTQIKLYKKKDFLSLENNSNINSTTLNEKINYADKKDIFVGRFTRSSNAIPTTGSTYVTINVMDITGLIAGEKYRIVTPVYLKVKSGSGPSSTTMTFTTGTNGTITNGYSSAGSNEMTYMVNRVFTADSSTMTLQVSSRYSGGLLVEANSGKIQFDIYQIND